MKNERKKQAKNTKGVTLISIVVTVIVLIILAGISINLMVGNNGTIKKASDARIDAQIYQIESDANTTYLQLQRDNKNKNIKLSDVIDEISKRYEIYTNPGVSSTITGITLDKDSVVMEANGNLTISAELTGELDDGSEYYAVVENRYYKMSIQNDMVVISKTSTRC